MATRIKLVWPGSGSKARLQKFYAISAAFHVAVVLFFMFVPNLFGDSRKPFSDDFYDTAMFAELVAGIDGSAGPPPKPAPAVEKEPEPEPEPPQPQPKPQPPPEETPAAGDVQYSKRAEPTPAKKDPDPAPPADDPGDAEATDNLDAPTGERVGDAGAGVSGGGEISLFGWYQASVSRALYASWQRPPLAGQRDSLAVTVGFSIQKDGGVTNLHVVESSGVPALDRSALRAVADASPFPRLPPAWRGSSMTALYQFELTPEDF